MTDEDTSSTLEPDRNWSRSTPSFRDAGIKRRTLLVGHEGLVVAIEQALFTSDPVGINFETNVDEYRPEAETITLRLLHDCSQSQADVKAIVIDEFAQWFGDFAVREPERYDPIASDIWGRWQQHLRNG